jgi:hypothetical protein
MVSDLDIFFKGEIKIKKPADEYHD